MILENLQIPELKNKVYKESGLDSFDHCIDKNYFLNYPHQITYSYNSRGYRDGEWPTDTELSECIWSIGDSFTVGLGSPYEHIWPQVLQKNLNHRVINVSMDGASNRWISRKTIEIIKEVNPKNIIVMWSYTHRRELDNINKTDMERRVWANMDTDEMEDLINFKMSLNSVVKASKNNLVHLVIPKAFVKQNKLNYEFNDIKNFLGEVTILDYARDYHHFDIQTSNQVAKQIIPLLTI